MTTWMVRSGPSEKWLQDFLGSNLVAAGWRELRDSNGRTLAGLTQSEIYEICEATYDDNPKTISAHASQVNMFINSIRGGDFVLVPSDSGKKISIGLIRSEAKENPDVCCTVGLVTPLMQEKVAVQDGQQKGQANGQPAKHTVREVTATLLARTGPDPG